MNKLFYVTTDGTPAVVGKNKRFVKLLKDHTERQVLGFSCLIHQENYYTKILSQSLNTVMETTVKIVP